MTLPDIRSDIPEEEMRVPDTCLDALKKVPSFLEQLRQLTGDPNLEFGEFKPCADYYRNMDMLLYLERDCSYTSQYFPGTNIELLWDNHPDHGGKLDGVKINQFSLVAPKEVIAAYRDEGMCVECGNFKADPPSDVCPGCEAYREHTR